jgi:hypothetical protein
VTGASEIIRTPITVWFIAFCPGMAVVRLLGLDAPLAEVMLAFALSLALAGLIPGILLYLGAWSPSWSLTMLVAIAATGLALDPMVVPRHGWISPGRAVGGWILDVGGPAGPAVGETRSLSPSARSRQKSLARLATPPMAVVTRLPPEASPTSADERSSARGSSLGSDPLAEDEASVALRSAFDRVIGDIADRRQRHE